MPRRWIDVLKSFSRKQSHDSLRHVENVPVMLCSSANFSAAGGSWSQACLRRLRLLRSHFTSPLFAIDINLDLMKIALMIFYDEIVLSSTRIWRFIVFSFAFYEIIRQKPRGNICCESSCWWLYYGDLNSFFHSSKRNILFHLWWTISQSDQQHTFTTATSAEKKFINQWHDDSFFGFPA